MLGDMGADVIKVEDPDFGDTTRGFPPIWNGESTYYMSTNRNKRGITLDTAPDRGTAFSVRLPVRIDVSAPSADAAGQLTRASSA